MKRINRFFGVAVLTTAVMVVLSQSLLAQDKEKEETFKNQQVSHNRHFVDENGDGFNDNAPDHDGDGIPNGQDPDYEPSGNGRGHGFIDVDGDGINDYAQDDDGDGIPNGKDPDYTRPKDGTGMKIGGGFKRDGTGMGFGGSGRHAGGGTGTCDGTGPRGNRTGRGK